MQALYTVSLLKGKNSITSVVSSCVVQADALRQMFRLQVMQDHRAVYNIVNLSSLFFLIPYIILQQHYFILKQISEIYFAVWELYLFLCKVQLLHRA